MLTASESTTRMSAAMEIASEKGSVALVWKSRPLMRRAPRKPASRPAADSDAGGAGGLTQDELKDVASIGSDGHADADFAGALGDGVGEHAEGSDGGEHERDESEGAEERGRHALARDGIGEHGFDAST